MGRVLRALGRMCLWLLLATAALAASVAFNSRLPIARRAGSGLISDLVSKAIRGTLVVTHLTDMSPGRIETGHVMLFDAKGRLIIDAPKLVLTVDLAALRALRIRISSARLDAAKVHLFDEGEGLPSLLTTFDSRTPSKGGGSGPPLRAFVDGITLSHATVDGDLLGLHAFRVRDLNAFGRLDIGRDVHVRIDRASLAMTEPFGFTGYVDALTGTISTQDVEGIDLHVRAHRDGEQARARVRLAASRAGSDSILSIEVEGQQLSATTLHGLGYTFVPELLVPVSGGVQLRGPTAELAIKASLSTAAGDAALEGVLSKARGTTVTLQTQHMQLAMLLSGFPPVTAQGSLRIDVPSDYGAPHLHAEVEPLLYESVAIPGFELDGVLAVDGLRIDSLTATGRGTSVTGHGHIYTAGGYEFEAHARVAEISHEKNLHRFFPDARGALEADLEVTSPRGVASSLLLRGHVALRKLSYGMVTANRIEVRGTAHGDPAHPRLVVDVHGDGVRLGEYLLGDPTLTVRGGPREYQAEGQFVSQGRRTFNLSATVTAQPQGFVANADSIEFSVGDGSWRGALEGLRVTGNDTVELGLLRLASHTQRLEARGILHLHGKAELDAQLQDFDLAAVNALLGDRFFIKQGRADAHIEIHGLLARPELRVQGALREGVVKGVHDVGALYLITYSAGQIEFDGEVDLGDRGLLRANGRGSVDPTISDPTQALRLGYYDVEVTADQLALSVLPTESRAGAQGSIRGTLNGNGTLDTPILQGRLDVTDLAFPGVSPITASVEGRYAGSALDAALDTSDARGPLLHADAHMQLDWKSLREHSELLSQTLLGGPWRVTGQTARRRLDQMPAPLSAHVPYPAAFESSFVFDNRDGTTQGSIDFDATWEGAVGTGCGSEVHPRGSGKLTLDRGISRIESVVRTDQSQLGSLSLSLDTPVDTWAKQGHIDPPSAFRARAQVGIAAFERIPFLCEYGNGSLNAEVELDGGKATEPMLVMTADSTFLPRVVHHEGRRSIPVRSCESDPMRMHLDLNVDGQYASGSGRTDGCLGGASTMTGRLPVQWKSLGVLPWFRSEGALQVLANFDGAQLKPLLDRIPGVINADALARGELSITGTVAQPSFGGSLDVNNGRVFLVGMGQELSGIDATLEFHGDWAKIEHLSARLGKGNLSAAGGLAFVGLTPRRARIAVNVSKLPIQREGLETAWLTGNAAIDAEIRAEKLRAAIVLHGFEVRLPDTVNRTLQPLERHPDVVIVTEIPEAKTDAYLIELAIDGRRGLRVKRNDFEATVTTELAATYRDPDLSLAGYVQFSRGEFEVFGKRFDVNSGGLRFDGSTDLNPEVYLLATQKPDAAGASPVTVTVHGTLDEPVVSFSSDLCPGEAAALTYLVSGQCASESPELAQQSQDAQNAFNTGVLSGVLTLGAQGQLSALSPRLQYESTAQGSQRYKAGISGDSLIPKFMRSFVSRMYVQGGVSTPGTAAGTTATPTQTGTVDTAAVSLDFLIELYFAHNIVGAGRFGQQEFGASM